MEIQDEIDLINADIFLIRKEICQYEIIIREVKSHWFQKKINAATAQMYEIRIEQAFLRIKFLYRRIEFLTQWKMIKEQEEYEKKG